MRSFDKPLILVVALAATLAACGGSRPTDPSSEMTGSPATPAPRADGEMADPAMIEASITKLATLDAFTHETTLGTSSLGEDYSLKITGVEHPLDGDRALFGQTNHGVEWASMSVDGAYFGDIGRGLEALDPREDATMATDPNWVANLFAGLSPQSDDFMFVGDETIEGRPVKHYALDEYGVGKLLTLYEDEPGFETFAVELWIDSADGYLTKAHYGRLPFATSGFTSMTEWHFELSDRGCDCPITAPVSVSTPVPATPEPTTPPLTAPKALTCDGAEIASSDLEWVPDPANPQEPTEIVRSWPGVVSTDQLAFGGMSIFVVREGAPIAEFRFNAFGRPTRVDACPWGEIATAG
jgi:hypothetical protein